MDFGFDDRLPSEHFYLPAFNRAEISASRAPADFLWLERFLPYDNSAENDVHWFLRFDRLK